MVASICTANNIYDIDNFICMCSITDEKLDRYFDITGRALAKVKPGKEREIDWKAKYDDFLDMATRYFEDAKHFRDKGDYVLAYGALNYAHGWLDAGARIKLFKVNDSRLFTVDD